MSTGEIKVKLTVDAEEYSNLLQNFKDLVDAIIKASESPETWTHPWDLEGTSPEYFYTTAYEAGQADFARDLLSKLQALPLKEIND